VWVFFVVLLFVLFVWSVGSLSFVCWFSLFGAGIVEWLFGLSIIEVKLFLSFNNRRVELRVF